MIISKDTVVAVNYRLTSSVNNGPGELVEETDAQHPFVFLFGTDGVLPDFESNLAGKQQGDKFDFKITAQDGYGMREADYVVKIDRGAFVIDGNFDDTRVKVGRELDMRDADGNPLRGMVTEITETHVEMDFNHPLAGHDLHFIGEVLEVRAATAEELDHGHVHGPGGHHHH